MAHYRKLLLGVNIDHVATLRQARGTDYPDPVHAAVIAQTAGADSITIHLREDRRHIQDRDVHLIRDVSHIPLNLECAVNDEMLAIACEVRPDYVCLVPEKREELTTEGGLDVAKQTNKIKEAVSQLTESGIKVSLFIDPDEHQIEAAIETEAPMIEIHTGRYADAIAAEQAKELEHIITAARYAHVQGIQVNAGHGLHYQNVQPVAQIAEIVELNIGHAIVAHAVLYGLAEAVSKMKQLMTEARR